jgi:hypothetical protein
MLDELKKRGDARGGAAVARAKRRIADVLDGNGIDAAVIEDGVSLSGRGLGRRLFTDARLRWIGSLFR